jgi:hypothetical protein
MDCRSEGVIDALLKITYRARMLSRAIDDMALRLIKWYWDALSQDLGKLAPPARKGSSMLLAWLESPLKGPPTLSATLLVDTLRRTEAM